MVTIGEQVKVILVGNSPRIAIPKSICKTLRMETGKTVDLETKRG